MTGLKVKSPCKECEDRCVGCHSTCRKYDFYRMRVAYVRHKCIEECANHVQKFRQIEQMRMNVKRDHNSHVKRKNYVTGGAV